MDRTKTLFIGALLLTVGLVGCTTPATEPNHVAFQATEYSFSGPETVPAGVTTLELESTGQEPHHIQLFKLEDGHTFEEFLSVLAEGGEGTMPDWAVPYGGPNAAFPAEVAGSSQATLDLEPGTYAMVCVIPDAEGTPHVAHGMAKRLVVEEEEEPGSLAQAASPDVTVDLDDFSFEVEGEITPGERTIEVVNNGDQPHELTLMELQGNATIEEVLAAFGPNATGPPPAVFLGGITGIAPGASQTFTATFQQGTYGLICFLPDVASEQHTPHFALGMQQTFEVG